VWGEVLIGCFMVLFFIVGHQLFSEETDIYTTAQYSGNGNKTGGPSPRLIATFVILAAQSWPSHSVENAI
jgi:hypothetical protein